MRSKRSMSIPDQHLIASTVYDQQNSYVGMVVNVNRTSDDQFSLLVKRKESQAEAGQQSGQLRIVDDAIQRIDVLQKKVYVDLEKYPPGSIQVESLLLWQEGVRVNRSRRKIGEVSIRKVTDVYTVEVPVRSEKLVVENVEDGEILAQVDLTNNKVTQRSTQRPLLEAELDQIYVENHVVKGHLTQFRDVVNFVEAVDQFPDNSFIKGKIALTLVKHTRTEKTTQTFESSRTALQVLTAMAGSFVDVCQDVYLEIWVGDRERATTYQNWLSRYRQLPPNSKPSTQKSTARKSSSQKSGSRQLPAHTQGSQSH